MGRVREKRRVEERRSEKRKSQRKKMQMCEKVGKMRNAVFFRWFVAPEGRKVGSLKRRVRSHLARWEMKTCTPLWRETLFQAKMYKTPHVRTTFGSWDVEKVHAVVARSTFRSQNVQNTPCSDHFWKLRCRKSAHRCGTKHISKSKCTRHTLFSDHFWKLRCRKSAHRCGAKHISKSKCTKHTMRGPLLEVEMSTKCTPLWREAHFEVNMLKTPGVRTTFWRSDVVSCGRRKGLCTFSKVSKTWWFCSISKNDGRRGTFEEDLRRCMSRGRRSTKDMFIRDVRRSGRWFPERGCILEHQMFRFAEMILRDRCSTSYDLISLFRGRRSTLDRWSGKIAKRIGTRPSALQLTLHFWRKSCRCVLFSMLSSSSIEGVSQNCFVLDVVKFKKWRSLAELLRFWCCQLRTMGKSRRIASFLTLSRANIEEISENCFVFDVVNFETWGSLAELLRFWYCQLWNMKKFGRIVWFSSLQIDRWIDRQTDK